jgi:hypothetical protein
MNTNQVNESRSLFPIVGKDVDKTVADSAVALVTAAQIPAGAQYACITNGAQPIMLTFDGTVPAAGTVGAYKVAAAEVWVGMAAIAAAKAIRQGGTSSVVHVSFWSR